MAPLQAVPGTSSAISWCRGWSLGGFIALTVANNHQQAINRLVLADTLAGKGPCPACAAPCCAECGLHLPSCRTPHSQRCVKIGPSPPGQMTMILNAILSRLPAGCAGAPGDLSAPGLAADFETIAPYVSGGLCSVHACAACCLWPVLLMESGNDLHHVQAHPFPPRCCSLTVQLAMRGCAGSVPFRRWVLACCCGTDCVIPVQGQSTQRQAARPFRAFESGACMCRPCL